MSIFSKALELLRGKQKEKELQEKNRQLEIENDKLFGLNKEKENLIEKLQNKQETSCKNKLVYNANNQYVVVIDCNDDTFEGYITPDKVEQLKSADTQTIINLLTPPKVEEKGSDFDVDKEEKEIVSNFLDIFNDVDDFEVVGDSVYFKGIRSVEIPSLIAARFVEILNKYKPIIENLENWGKNLSLDEEYQSLKNFTLKLLCNPIEESRNTLLNFVRSNNVAMTSSGNLILYRRVWKKKGNDELLKFVTQQYAKIKQQKKSPKHYEVFDDNGFIIVQGDKRHNYNNHQGNLYDLYHNLGKEQNITYTDDYTRSYTIQIPGIYKIKEEDIDLNKNGSCGGLLHLANPEKFSYSGYGDTDVMCLVNPMNIARTDTSYSGKIGVSEMYICQILNGIDWDKNQNIVNFDEEYEQLSLQEIETALRMKDLSKFSVSTEVTGLNYKELETIKNLLKNRIVTI